MDKAYQTETQCHLVFDIISSWYGDGYPDYSPVLRKAIERTVQAGLFNEADIHYSLKAHYEAIDLPKLKHWVKSSIPDIEVSDQKPSVLCLHAGNFPLAGLQNALGVLLSGAEYWGKLSSNDPYLLDSFLDMASEYELHNLKSWSADLESLKPTHLFDAVLFAGDTSSVPTLRTELQEQEKTDRNTQFLVRTTHYSVAYLYEINDKVMDELTEAMLRYEGLGCRSVAAIVTQNKLNSCQMDLEKSIKTFLKKHPPLHICDNYARYHMAYNKAREVNQIYAPPFLIQEAEDTIVKEGLIFWIRGDVNRLEKFIGERQDELQTVYSDKPELLAEELNIEQPIEYLSQAQKPSIDWRADGVDTIEWIWNNLVH